MVKILNTFLSTLVYKLFIDTQRNISIRCNISIQLYLGCLHETEIKFIKKYHLIG